MISHGYANRFYSLVVIACLLSVTSYTRPALTQAPSTKPTIHADEAIFEWFDQLGFKDYSNLTFVKVTTRWWSQSSGSEPENHVIHAFLLDESDDSFSVFTLALSESSFRITPPDAPAHTVVKFARENLAEYARTVLREHAERETRDRDVWRTFGRQVNEGTEFVVLARACAAQQEPELSKQLMVAATELLRLSRIKTKPNATFQEKLSDDLANMTIWRIILEFGETEPSRAELLAKLEKYLKNYPDSTHSERAKLTAIMLRTMLAEEQDHVAQVDFEKLTVEEKVAELIFRLRDQNGRQFMQPGECDIFLGDRFANVSEQLGEIGNVQRQTKSPAQQLVEIGFDAVPQLIESLDDQRLTRSVGYHRDFYFSHHVLRVGDCAEQILCRIANRNFYQRTYTNGAMVKDGAQMAVKKQVEDWWREVTTKGEKQVLVDATKLGDDNSAHQAQRLLDKYPDVALDAIATGTENAKSIWIRNRMITLASSMGQPAGEFLMVQMENSPDLSSRVEAANQIDQHNMIPKVAVESMIREWNNVTEIAGKTASKTGAMAEGVERLVQFLTSKDSLECAKALHNNYHVHSITTRFEIVTAFGTSRGSISSFATGLGGALNVPSTMLPVGDLVQKEIESLLINALGDTDRREGLSGSWGDFSFSDPRICDVAGYVLAERFPDKYKFNPNAASDIVEAQRVRAINLWRKNVGIELSPEFESRKIVRLPLEKTEPILTGLLAATDEAERNAAMKGVEKLGIGALPALIEAIEANPAHPMGLPEFRSLAKKLSVTVTKVTVADESLPLTEQLKKQLEFIEGHPLSEIALVDLLLVTVNDLPEGKTGIQLTAIRNNGESGVELKVEMTKEWPPENGTQQMWNYRWSVYLNSRNVDNASGSASVDYSTKREVYSDFAIAANKALASEHDNPFQIRFSLIRDE